MCVCVVALIGPARAQAQTPAQTPPPTQDDQFRSQLGLGNATGCVTLLGLNPQTANGQDVADELTRLGSSIGNELRAICGPSAVTSASSLGGGLDTLQATKTSTQFRLARRRIDQRLVPAVPKVSAPSQPGRALRQRFVLNAPPAFAMGGLAAAWGDDAGTVSGVGLFGEVRIDQRDRIGTRYEAAYESSTKGFTAGVDYLRDRTLVGGWFSANDEGATFTNFAPLVPGTAQDTFDDVLGTGNVLSQVCGGLKDGGRFDGTTKAFGGFVGSGFGASGFADATFGWSQRSNQYARSVCVIEADPNGLKFVNGVLSSDGSGVIDDIYAGTLSGRHDVREINGSVRIGGSVGTPQFMAGPRVAFTLTRTDTAAYAETGRSTVANLVHPVFGNDVTRALGGPIGIELAFNAQRQTSALLDAGGEVAARAGRVVPFASGYWRHEFLDGYRLVTARFVQDRRQAPSRFQFGNDRPDSNSVLIGFGAAVPVGDRGVIRLEATRLAFHYLFSAFSLSAQARLQF